MRVQALLLSGRQDSPLKELVEGEEYRWVRQSDEARGEALVEGPESFSFNYVSDSLEHAEALKFITFREQFGLNPGLHNEERRRQEARGQPRGHRGPHVPDPRLQVVKHREEHRVRCGDRQQHGRVAPEQPSNPLGSINPPKHSDKPDLRGGPLLNLHVGLRDVERGKRGNLHQAASYRGKEVDCEAFSSLPNR